MTVAQQASRSKAPWIVAALIALTVASFWSLDLQWKQFLGLEGLRAMGKFLAELASPDLSERFLKKLLPAAMETLAMSAVGTLIAAVLGLALALPAARTHDGDAAPWRGTVRLLLNAMRSIPELVWAALLLISAGLGPFAGTLALAFHTTGVLGRLFAESLENAPRDVAANLRAHGASPVQVFWYATFPTVLPQLMSYTLYRWENNIRAAAILGVVGGGGLGQMLAFHMGLFQMSKTATVLLAMLALVALVDALSFWMRGRMAR